MLRTLHGIKVWLPLAVIALAVGAPLGAQAAEGRPLFEAYAAVSEDDLQVLRGGAVLGDGTTAFNAAMLEGAGSSAMATNVINGGAFSNATGVFIVNQITGSNVSVTTNFNVNLVD
jgi:hypothetical protein